jgi:hypothetical protein
LPLTLPGGGWRAPAAEQREAAQGDAREDGRAADDLLRASGVAEKHGAGRGADEGLQVQERPGHLGGHPALPEGEQGERQQRAGRHQAQHRQRRASGNRGRGQPARQREGR